MKLVFPCACVSQLNLSSVLHLLMRVTWGRSAVWDNGGSALTIELKNYMILLTENKNNLKKKNCWNLWLSNLQIKCMLTFLVRDHACV